MENQDKQLTQNQRRINIPWPEKIRLIASYARGKVLEQIPSVLFIVAYLIVFQVFVLGLPLSDALVLGLGLAMVILGLAFFLEGLALGLMPLGETIGIRLPKRTSLPLVLVFACLLGFGATLAEPAISALKVAGSAVKAWEAPLLFILLNKYSYLLVIAIGAGVAIAVCLGMIRFYRNWSLKPLIYSLIGTSLSLSLVAWFNPNLAYLTGIAWDCGAITTGPVTVPLVLALGLGISKIVGKGESSLSGFGVITLASTVPIITVFGLGFILAPTSPQPMNDQEFASAGQRPAIIAMFTGQDEYRAYIIRHGSPEARLALFDFNPGVRDDWYRRLQNDPELRHGQFGSDPDAFQRWLVSSGTHQEQEAFYGSPLAIGHARQSYINPPSNPGLLAPLIANAISSVQAVLPLCLFLLFTLVVVLRDRLHRPDEVIFGIGIALIGMFFLNAGIELGLSRLGNSVGTALPATIKAIDLPENTIVIPGFSLDNVYKSVDPNGNVHEFFYLHQGSQTREIPFVASAWHAETTSYDLVPQRGPLLGPEAKGMGLVILLLFAFIMGYGATMAEPALITMGRTVEEITVGIFRRKRLMQAVALGVGIGIAFGILKIVFNISLIWLLLPPYLLLMVLTVLSDEHYVNIAWDSAGVTTGPVTVPLVLAMGLGLGTQLGVAEGFGILAMASAYPILVVLAMGLFLKHRQKASMRGVESGESNN